MTDQASKAQRAAEMAALIVAVAEHRDAAAFAKLFDDFAPRIKSLLMRSGSSAGQAEELAQEAMLTVWQKASLFDPVGSNAAAWIFRIAHNLRIDAARKAQRGDKLQTALAAEPLDVAEPDAIVSAQQADAKVREALAQLSAEQMQVITLSFFENRPHAEIAELLQLPLGTVKSRIRLAFKRLRTLLDEVA